MTERAGRDQDLSAAQLAAEGCAACRADAPVVTPQEIAALSPLIPEWELLDRDGPPRLTRTFRFPNFAAALAFTDRVGALAEAAGHHPSITTEWGRVTVVWTTKKIRNLHRNDFIMAAKTDQRFTEAG